MRKIERELIAMQPEEFARLVFTVLTTYDSEDHDKYVSKLLQLTLKKIEIKGE